MRLYYKLKKALKRWEIRKYWFNSYNGHGYYIIPNYNWEVSYHCKDLSQVYGCVEHWWQIPELMLILWRARNV